MNSLLKQLEQLKKGLPSVYDCQKLSIASQDTIYEQDIYELLGYYQDFKMMLEKVEQKLRRNE